MAEPHRSASSSNVYTVLLLIALLALIGAFIYVWYRGYTLFGSVNPFVIPGDQVAMLPRVLGLA